MRSESETPDEAAALDGDQSRVDWVTIDHEQIRRGLEAEHDFGENDPAAHAIRNDLLWTGMLAWAHLKETQDYHARMDRLNCEVNDESETTDN